MVYPNRMKQLDERTRYEILTVELFSIRDHIPKYISFLMETQPDLYKHLMTKAFETLEPDEKDILESRYGLDGKEPQARREISERYGVSHDTIISKESCAMRKLIQSSNLDLFKECHDNRLELEILNRKKEGRLIGNETFERKFYFLKERVEHLEKELHDIREILKHYFDAFGLNARDYGILKRMSVGAGPEEIDERIAELEKYFSDLMPENS